MGDPLTVQAIQFPSRVKMCINCIYVPSVLVARTSTVRENHGKINFSYLSHLVAERGEGSHPILKS